jgi:demethylmenaquinone methyltransferase/2-methoxy-6-polyprenyl-1,4-benzoquinol methylase
METSSSSTPRVVGSEVQRMFGSIAARYDLTNSVLSLGIHHLWKHLVVRRVPRGAGPVLDLCTGTGDLLPLLERRTTGVVGGDFCLPMLERGRERGRSDAPLVQCDALNLPFPDRTFTAVTVAFGVRNLEDVRRGLKEIRRVLTPGGKLVILEFGQPTWAPFRAVYNWYSRVLMPWIGGLLTGNRSAYTYLPETAKAFPSGGDFEVILREAGFSATRYDPLSGGIAYIYEGTRDLSD